MCFVTFFIWQDSFLLIAHSMYQNIPIHHYCFTGFKIKKLIIVTINTFMQILKPINTSIFFFFCFVELGICITFSMCTYNTYWNVIILYYGISVLKNYKKNLCNTMRWDWTDWTDKMHQRWTWCQNTAKHVKIIYSTYFVIWEYAHVSDTRSRTRICFYVAYTYLIQGRVHVSATRSIP